MITVVWAPLVSEGTGPISDGRGAGTRLTNFCPSFHTLRPDEDPGAFFMGSIRGLSCRQMS